MHSDYIQRIGGDPQSVAQPEIIKSESDRAHLFGLRAGVGLPMLQAVISGFVVAMLVWWIAWQFFHAAQSWRWALGAFIVVWTFAWFFLLISWRYLVRPIELFFHRDIDGDGKVGDYDEDEIPFVKAQVWSEDGQEADQDRIPTSLSKLTELARGVLAGKPITEAEWCGENKPFSKREFRAVRFKFFERGWAMWRNPDHHDQGAVLTREGLALMHAIIERDEDYDD